ncbi:MULTISPECIES: putative DNA modification/repair radical SAM protein [Desulfosediminicola]|uniref:putative DNA modification/repair radical SAM protein n=1 Tax=Desulfosediminicola TaxID=2886823 RepID=UPI0010AB7784|nr:putative DNA modification/repair radical SAM protein [Desulfosediminicola ganghwensis]
MKLSEKLTILADAAKYDASCASSGSSRSNTLDGIGNAAQSGICHSWSADGRCISLLKVLMSNDCLFDCSYCLSRRSNTLPRATFTPEELADLTINFYLRNYIEGLFLSSAVYGSVNRTMADLVAVCRLLRTRHKFNGYIHLKVIPGADQELVRQAGFLVDRLSVNIELPSESSLKLLAPQKTRKAILAPMSQIGEEYAGYRQEKKKSGKAPTYCPGGQATQMIVGASKESDYQILNLTEHLYRRMSLKRVYFSAYIAVNEAPILPAVASLPPLIREHRLYQADWLLRFYRFHASEILSETSPNLDMRLDPKAGWALRNYDLFPLDINRASYEELLRVPGLGMISAQRIVATRRVAPIREEDLKKIGLVMKRAKHFISINGRFLGDRTMSHGQLAAAMYKAETPASKKVLQNSRQLRLFKN